MLMSIEWEVNDEKNIFDTKDESCRNNFSLDG